MSEAKQISFPSERTIESIVAEIKAHLSSEIHGLQQMAIERPYNAKESAAFLKINVKTFYRWIKDGVIPSDIIHYVGSNIMCYASDLDRFVKSRRNR